MAKAKRMREVVPLFDKLVKLEVIEGSIRARSRSGTLEREGAMTPSLFRTLVVKGVTLLHKHGLLPTFTALGKLERMENGEVRFRLGWADQPDLYIEAHVTLEVAENGRDQLNDLVPTRVIRLRDVGRPL